MEGEVGTIPFPFHWSDDFLLLVSLLLLFPGIWVQGCQYAGSPWMGCCVRYGSAGDQHHPAQDVSTPGKQESIFLDINTEEIQPWIIYCI